MTSRSVDIIKDLATYGAAFFVVAFGMYEVAKLAELNVIDGATTMTFFTNIASAAVGFLFGVALARTTQRSFEKGLATPTPGADGTLVTGDNPTVQSGGPTTVTTPTETRNA